MESRSGRYLAGLCAAALGVCGGGWLVLTPFAFGYRGRGREAITALATGGGLIVVSAMLLLCWALALRRRLRIDGVLASRQSRTVKRRAERKTERSARRSARRSAGRQARAERLVRASRQRELETAPDPAQVLTDLRALLTPLLSAAEESVSVVPAPAPAERAAADEVPAPGHLRGSRSASFFAVPKQVEPPLMPEPLMPNSLMPNSLMKGAELLMVGTGEEESW